MLYQKHDDLPLVLDNIKYLVILEVIKYENASFLCNKVDIFVIWEGLWLALACSGMLWLALAGSGSSWLWLALAIILIFET